MLVIVVMHHLCASLFSPLFTASLNMHLCFAVSATQVSRVLFTGNTALLHPFVIS